MYSDTISYTIVILARDNDGWRLSSYPVCGEIWNVTFVRVCIRSCTPDCIALILYEIEQTYSLCPVLLEISCHLWWGTMVNRFIMVIHLSINQFQRFFSSGLTLERMFRNKVHFKTKFRKMFSIDLSLNLTPVYFILVLNYTIRDQKLLPCFIRTKIFTSCDECLFQESKASLKDLQWFNDWKDLTM